MSPLFRPASAHLAHFHAGQASSVAVLTWQRRGKKERDVRVLRSPQDFAATAEPRDDPSQTLVFEGNGAHSKVIDNSLSGESVSYYTVFVKNDAGRWRREICTAVPMESDVHWRRAGVEGEGESLGRFREMWTDLDALG